jgi:hypothetical protein
MIRRSSTPDCLQTSLSIYQYKSALSRKSAPLAFTSFRRPCLKWIAITIQPNSIITMVHFNRTSAIWLLRHSASKQLQRINVLWFWMSPGKREPWTKLVLDSEQGRWRMGISRRQYEKWVLRIAFYERTCKLYSVLTHNFQGYNIYYIL